MVFRDSARELILRLSSLSHPLAHIMRREAEEILNAFDLWEKYPPLAPERVQTISRLLDLHRRVLEFIVKK